MKEIPALESRRVRTQPLRVTGVPAGARPLSMSIQEQEVIGSGRIKDEGEWGKAEFYSDRSPARDSGDSCGCYNQKLAGTVREPHI